MKRYLLFIYSKYYPDGGMKDFFNSYDSIENALNAYEQKLLEDYESVKFGDDNELEYLNSQKTFHLYHIYDTQKMQIVKE